MERQKKPVASPPPLFHTSKTVSTASQGLAASSLQEERKRTLILAHATQQASSDPLQRMTVFVGAMALFLLISIFWVWTLRPVVMRTINQPFSPELRNIVTHSFADANRVPFVAGHQRAGINDIVRMFDEQQRQRRVALERLAQVVNAGVTSTSSTAGSFGASFIEEGIATTTARDIFVPATGKVR